MAINTGYNNQYSNTPKFGQPTRTDEEHAAFEVAMRQKRERNRYRQSLPFEERKQFDRAQIDRRLQRTKNDEEWAAGADERYREEKNEAKLRAENPFYDYDQSSVGIESNINRRNLQQEMDDARKQIGRFALYSPEQKEASRKYQVLRDSMDIFDAQLGESRESWQKKGSLQSGPKMQTPSSTKVGKYDGMTKHEMLNADLMERGYLDRSGATIPYADRSQGKPGQKGQGQARGMPREFMQSPAMAQKRTTFTPYNQRGQSLKGEALDAFYRKELNSWKQGVRAPEFNRNNNPYWRGHQDNQYDKNKAITDFSMEHWRDPSLARNYTQSLYS